MPIRHYHPPLRLHGRVYDLTHLEPFRFAACSAKVPRPLRINVRFTNHCYSEAFPARHGRAMDHGREKTARLLSRPLPPLSPSSGADPRHGKSGYSRSRDGVTPKLDVCRHRGDARRGDPIPNLLRSPASDPERRQLQDLDMVVESAYLADPGRTEPNILGRANFLLLAGSLYLGKAVMTWR
jgi:hypothetical protein